ncbi:hypothetical protein P2318_33460 [Myxococcaceae bacterium GXIMD 01537]
MDARAVQRGGWLGLVLWGVASVAAAQPASLTGVYDRPGGTLVILQGTNETLLHFTNGTDRGREVGSCECPLVLAGKPQGTRWALRSVDGAEEWTLRLEPERLVLDSGSPGCCGMSSPGIQSFSRGNARAPARCTVRAPRAYFFSADGQGTQRKAYAVAGDSVEAFVPATSPDLVPARTTGKKATVGLMRREELECQGGGSTDVKAVAGRWLNVERQGRGFVILRPCEANTPNISISPSGELEVERGMEGARGKVTGVSPGAAAGAYSLEVEYEGGAREVLAWTVVDAKRDIIRLQGGRDLFREGMLLVRESRKRGIPVKAEKCESEEPY